MIWLGDSTCGVGVIGGRVNDARTGSGVNYGIEGTGSACIQYTYIYVYIYVCKIIVSILTSY